MLTRTVSIPVPNPFPPQEPSLTVELPPRSSAEQHRLRRVQTLVQAHRLTTDLTTLAGEVRQLMGEGYVVGGGAAHIWLLRQGERERLAIIADQLTTTYRSCPQAWEPLPVTPSRSRHRRKRLKK